MQNETCQEIFESTQGAQKEIETIHKRIESIQIRS